MVPLPLFPVFCSLPHKIQLTCLDFSQHHNFLSASIGRSVCSSYWHMTSAPITVLGMFQTSTWHMLPPHMEQLLQMFSVLSSNPPCSSPLLRHPSTCTQTHTNSKLISADVQRPPPVPFLKGFHSFLILSACTFPHFSCLYLQALCAGPLTNVLSLALLLHLTTGVWEEHSTQHSAVIKANTVRVPGSRCFKHNMLFLQHENRETSPLITMFLVSFSEKKKNIPPRKQFELAL